MHMEAATCYKMIHEYSNAVENYKKVNMFSDILDCSIAGNMFQEGFALFEEYQPMFFIELSLGFFCLQFHISGTKANYISGQNTELCHCIIEALQAKEGQRHTDESTTSSTRRQLHRIA